MNDKICGVVVTFNRRELLRHTLTSLLTQSRPLDAILIVDNASTDGTAEMLKCDFSVPGVQVLRLPENTGGAGGFQTGIQHAYAAGYEWIWVMDDDVEPAADCLATLMKYSHEYKVMVPVHLIKGSSRVIEHLGMHYDFKDPFIGYPRKQVVSEIYAEVEELPEVIEVQEITFEGPLFAREVIQKIGFPNSNLFIYSDDVDYAVRANRQGYKIALIKGAVLLKERQNAPGESYWRTYYFYRNAFYLDRIYGENALVKNRPLWKAFAASARFLMTPSKISKTKKAKVVMLALRDVLRKDIAPKYKPGDTFV